jgi:RecA/RadA recombinase
MWRKWDLSPRSFLPGENTSGYTEKAPPHRGVIWDETAEDWIPKPSEPAEQAEPTADEQIEALKRELGALDLQSIRAVRAAAAAAGRGEEPATEDIARLAELDEQARELRDHIRRLQGEPAESPTETPEQGL